MQVEVAGDGMLQTGGSWCLERRQVAREREIAESEYCFAKIKSPLRHLGNNKTPPLTLIFIRMACPSLISESLRGCV